MWVRVDDGVPQHPKFLHAGREASWFWVCGNCYCNKYLTDGFISEHALISLSPGAPHRRLAALLVTAKLWEKVAGGYNVHDFHDHNPRSEHVKIKREQDRLRKRLQADSSTAQPASTTPAIPTRSIVQPPEFPDGIHAESSRSSIGIHTESERNPSGVQMESEAPRGRASAPAIPSHPIPSRPDPREEKETPVSHVFCLGSNGSTRQFQPDEAWEFFKSTYPAKRRSSGFMANQLFLAACESVGFSTLITALEKQKAGEEWRRGLIPSMQNWLDKGLWIQEPDDPKASDKIALEHLAELDRRKAERNTR